MWFKLIIQKKHLQWLAIIAFYILVNIRQDEILNERQLSAKCLENQAKKMIKKFEVLEVGVNVRVSIPDVDRARVSPRNLLAVIISIEDDMYKLGRYANFKIRKLI